MNRCAALVVLVVAAVVGGAGCRTPVITLSRVVVMNQTQEVVGNVKVLHLPTRRQGSVSEILPGRDLVVEMEPSPMQATEAEVSWTDSGGAHRVNLDLPCKATTDAPGTLVYSIAPRGRVVVFLAEEDDDGSAP